MEHRYQKLSFQCSRYKASTSRVLRIQIHYPVTNGCCQWRKVVSFPGWTQENSYRRRRSSRAERGVPAYSPARSELPKSPRDTR
ncbi:hypothetical protein LU90_24205 [Salmonella enterica]|nr:hypothetical protein [Salmonella enterica]EBR3874052.1 hypothetical protein [Salmonella enterica subsp. enterica]EDS6397768.1 hypothetical protein [Salmonella enterica subsp. enterica serovar Minnesota]EFD0973730.1 hypothetical protein [Escherichia coli]EBP1382669.1 hypothetical protein [Salmonella enterica]